MNEFNRISSLTLSELSPYILGKEFTGEAKNVPRCDPKVYEQFLTMLSEDKIAKSFFDVYDNYKDFYKTAYDFKMLIPKEQQMECFYAAKNECYYMEIPAFCVYVLKRAYDSCNGIPNLILKTVPLPALTEWFKKDYFLGGLTLRDVICSVCNPNYNPLSVDRPKNKVGNFTEVYVASTDMVAAVPNNIADCLDDKSIAKIELGDLGLNVDGILLRTMCNYVGAINSNYDLRALI